MKKNLGKTFIALILVIAMLFMFCVIAYANTGQQAINDNGNPVIQQTVDYADVVLTEPDTNPPIEDCIGFINNFYLCDPLYYIALLSGDTAYSPIHIDPGRYLSNYCILNA